MQGISVIWGGAAGMETLAGQAYGARNLRMMRLVLLRAMVVCWALCVPIALAWQHAEWLLIRLGQCPVMSATGAAYLQALVPSLFVYVLAECLQSYFVCQNNVQPATWAKGITALLGPVLYYLLMFKCVLSGGPRRSAQRYQCTPEGGVPGARFRCRERVLRGHARRATAGWTWA